MGVALENVDNLIRIPCGCGEQTMLGLIENAYSTAYNNCNYY